MREAELTQRETVERLLSASRIAIVGNAGGGKSTLAQKLAAVTGHRAIHVDQEQWVNPDTQLSELDFVRKHEEWMSQPSWIIDGFGTKKTFLDRIELADAIVFVDFPVFSHMRLVTKRAVETLMRAPAGWPANSLSILDLPEQLRFTYSVHRRWTPSCRALVEKYSNVKLVIRLESVAMLGRLNAAISDRSDASTAS